MGLRIIKQSAILGMAQGSVSMPFQPITHLGEYVKVICPKPCRLKEWRGMVAVVGVKGTDAVVCQLNVYKVGIADATRTDITQEKVTLLSVPGDIVRPAGYEWAICGSNMSANTMVKGEIIALEAVITGTISDTTIPYITSIGPVLQFFENADPAAA